MARETHSSASVLVLGAPETAVGFANVSQAPSRPYLKCANRMEAHSLFLDVLRLRAAQLALFAAAERSGRKEVPVVAGALLGRKCDLRIADRGERPLYLALSLLMAIRVDRQPPHYRTFRRGIVFLLRVHRGTCR